VSAADISIVVLAAGAARRFGEPKLIVPIAGVALIRRAVMAALASVAKVVVVTGAQREPIEAAIADLPVMRVFNPEWASGMGSSIACGIARLDSSTAAAIVSLADQALIGAAEFNRLIRAHARAPERIIAAQYSGVLGAPCLFPHAHFGELAALRGEQGARVVLERNAGCIDGVAMAAAAFDIDTPADLAGLPPQA